MSEDETRLAFDDERCNAAYEDLVEVFQKHKLTVGEIIVAYGNLGYALGASIGGFSEKGPSPEELKKLYYEHPGRLDLTVTTWYGDWEQLQLGTEDNDKEGND